MLDLVIIGASAAGCSAAVYAARRNLNFLIVSDDIGGEVALSGEVENWPGVIHTTGVELAQNFHDHVKNYNVKIDEGFRVQEIKQVENYHVVVAKNFSGEERTYETKTVIIATGIHPRSLDIPGEKEFKGKGVTYCTVCDGPLFRNKITATVGAGNSALESALMLSTIAQKAYLITKYPDDPSVKGGFPKGENILVDKVKATDNIEIIYNAMTCEILGEGLVNKLCYIDEPSGEKQYIDVNGVMVHIGVIPNSDFTNCANKNSQKEFEIDLHCRTSCPGVFAAGDVTSIQYKQISIAAGQGATAALSAIEYINKWHPKS
ncbi:FAD-dependent oxidoreductase [Candidatus Nomurabacteria bacterium]|nr:FAD-dependent oxidoreductase [Candidatus Nomurabacteria bacterium]